MSDLYLSSNRSFGIVFFVVFFIIAFYPLINNQEIRIWSLLISLIFFILGLINSNFLTPLNKIWTKFGMLLGKILSPFIIFFIFYLVVTPIGLFMRLLKKDLINLKFNSEKSYWIKKTSQKTNMKKQF